MVRGYSIGGLTEWVWRGSVYGRFSSIFVELFLKVEGPVPEFNLSSHLDFSSEILNPDRGARMATQGQGKACPMQNVDLTGPRSYPLLRKSHVVELC